MYVLCTYKLIRIYRYINVFNCVCVCVLIGDGRIHRIVRSVSVKHRMTGFTLYCKRTPN